MPFRGPGAGVLLSVVLLTWSAPTPSQELPVGQVIVNLPCEQAPGLGYALYLPTGYTSDKPWPLLLGFHYDCNGRAIVDTYRAAAERYGYIVAGLQ